MSTRVRWELQRYDHSWGGWRGLPMTTLSDEPARLHGAAPAGPAPAPPGRGDAVSIRHLAYVACDCCGDPAEAVPEAASEARRIARRYGWQRRRGHDLCPDCARHDAPGEHCKPELFGAAELF